MQETHLGQQITRELDPSLCLSVTQPGNERIGQREFPISIELEGKSRSQSDGSVGGQGGAVEVNCQPPQEDLVRRHDCPQFKCVHRYGRLVSDHDHQILDTETVQSQNHGYGD